jgi:hypothetical protein
VRLPFWARGFGRGGRVPPSWRLPGEEVTGGDVELDRFLPAHLRPRSHWIGRRPCAVSSSSGFWAERKSAFLPGNLPR